MLDSLRRRLSFARPIVYWFRRHREGLHERRRPRRLMKEARSRRRRRRIRRIITTRRSLVDELSRRDEGYEQRIKELESDRWSFLGSIPAATSPRQPLKILRSEITKFQRHSYGNYRPGNSVWAAKWEANPQQRVVMFSRQDTAGSLYKWADAVNTYTPWAVRLAVFEPHAFGFPTDLVFPHPEYADSDLERLLSESTVIHLKDESAFLDGKLHLPRDFLSRHGKPMVFTHYGGSSRQYQHLPDYQSFVLNFDARIALTPDLLFSWFNGTYIPLAIDIRNIPNQWQPGNLLCHSPSNAKRHGTKVIQKAVELAQSQSDIDFDLIQGLSHQECLERKRRATLFFDRVGRELRETYGTSEVIGWHGNSAIEAAAYGIPTMSHLADWAIDAARESLGSLMDYNAVINVGLEVKEIRDRILWFFNLPEEEQQVLSNQTRTWIEMLHSYKATGPALAGVYDSII